MRGDKPFVFTDCLTGTGVSDVVSLIRRRETAGHDDHLARDEGIGGGAAAEEAAIHYRTDKS